MDRLSIKFLHCDRHDLIRRRGARSFNALEEGLEGIPDELPPFRVTLVLIFDELPELRSRTAGPEKARRDVLQQGMIDDLLAKGCKYSRVARPSGRHSDQEILERLDLF